MHLFTHCLAFRCAHTVIIVISGTQQANIRQQGELIITGFGALNHVLSTNVFVWNNQTLARRLKHIIKSQGDISRAISH